MLFFTLTTHYDNKDNDNDNDNDGDNDNYAIPRKALETCNNASIERDTQGQKSATLGL